MYAKVDNFLYPKRLQLELTSRCNYKCIICGHGYRCYGEDISDKLKNIFIDELIPHANYLELQGAGESLLYEGIDSILEAAEKNKCEVSLTTNASLLDAKHMGMLAKAGCQLVISLDSVTPKTYEAMRVGGDLDKVKQNLSFWKFIRNNIKSNFQPSLTINMVLCSLNYKELCSMIDYASEIWAHTLCISEIRPCMLDDAIEIHANTKSSAFVERPYMPEDMAWENLSLKNLRETSSFWALIAESKAYATSKGLNIMYNFNKDNPKQRKRNICMSPWEHCFIGCKGDLYTCCEIRCDFGNIERYGFDAVWNGDKLNKFRESMSTGQYHTNCRKCCLRWGIMNE